MANNDDDKNNNLTDKRNLIANKFLELQLREVDSRDSDRENQKQIALASIEAGLKHHNADIDFLNKESTKRNRLIITIVVITVVFIAYLVFAEQAEMAGDITEKAALGLGTFLGGYGLAKRKN